MYLTKGGLPIKSRDWHKRAIEMFCLGHGSTHIAEVLLGRKTQESTVRDFLSKVDFDKVNLAKKPLDDELKILFFDIESSPALSAHWGEWQQNINKESKVRDYGILSHAWAWGTGEVHSSVLTPQEALDNNAERIIYEMWSLLDNANVVVGHNCKKFDLKRANAEFMKLGLPPPSPYKVYDTLRVAKRQFKFARNDLDSLCKTLNIPFRKVSHEGMALWMKCVQGDVEALSKMQEYNEGDIPTLRALFQKLLPWDNDGVNFGGFVGGSDDVSNCPNCGHNSLVITDKFVYSGTRKHKLYKCQECGSNARSTSDKSELSNSFVRVL